MVKKLLTLLFTSVLAFPLSTVFAPASGPSKAAKEVRWEGVVIRSSTDKSTLTVDGWNPSRLRCVICHSSTPNINKEHGSK